MRRLERTQEPMLFQVVQSGQVGFCERDLRRLALPPGHSDQGNAIAAVIDKSAHVSGKPVQSHRKLVRAKLVATRAGDRTGRELMAAARACRGRKIDTATGLCDELRRLAGRVSAKLREGAANRINYGAASGTRDFER